MRGLYILLVAVSAIPPVRRKAENRAGREKWAEIGEAAQPATFHGGKWRALENDQRKADARQRHNRLSPEPAELLLPLPTIEAIAKDLATCAEMENDAMGYSTIPSPHLEEIR